MDPVSETETLGEGVGSLWTLPGTVTSSPGLFCHMLLYVNDPFHDSVG